MPETTTPRPGREPGRGTERRVGGLADERSGGHRRQQQPREPLADLGRAVTDGSGTPGGRLRAAADQAARMVAAGEVDRASAVTALWLAAQAAGIGSARALAAIDAAFRRAGAPS